MTQLRMYVGVPLFGILIGVLLSASVNAHTAYTVQIDPSNSIIHTSGGIAGGGFGDLQISGTFKAIIIESSIWFTDIDITLAPEAHSFEFPQYVGIIHGSDFSGTQCPSTYPSGLTNQYSGIISGWSFSMEGVYRDPVYDGYQYDHEIAATLIPMPGACCLSDGSCTKSTEAQCEDAGGTYQGDDTDCASVNCVRDCPDSDGDGIPDEWDQCPNTPIGSAVYSNGCTAFCVEPVQCDLTPDATVIPRGGTLGFEATVTNNTGMSVCVFYATKVDKPDGTMPGWLIRPIEVCLGPYQSKSKHLSHTIPGGFELGMYTYHGYVGRYGNIYNECQFDFEVVP